ncbi:hypothetical protein LTR53_006283 [Teratosphaeriaceae sp. CCFEE 6253]|nr:hypothetical protein LTR53_006283 [Teratosphaeriaceae sp. CCFEE 6253]
MATSSELADIILARQSVALARSQRLLQSWLPPKAEESSTTAAVDDDHDFEGMTELAGVGSKRKAADEGVLDGLKRRKVGAKDKLLEQLLGKKAAQARVKARESAAGSRAGLKPAVGKKPVIKEKNVESEDEEEGRAASFKSRKAKVVLAPITTSEPEPKGEGVEGVAGGFAEDVSRLVEAEHQPPRNASPPRAKKQKAGSYLDELLAQKAAKKKGKKKKHMPEAATEP